MGEGILNEGNVDENVDEVGKEELGRWLGFRRGGGCEDEWGKKGWGGGGGNNEPCAEGVAGVVTRGI